MTDIVQLRESPKKEQCDDKYEIMNSTNNDVAKFIMLQERIISKDQKKKKYSSSDDLTLSCILNTIDGVLENYGRILIITTNYPEKLDNALVRPGRIDLKVNYSRCTNQMMHDNENKKIDKKILFQDDKYTPAEVLEVCARNYDDMEKTVKYFT